MVKCPRAPDGPVTAWAACISGRSVRARPRPFARPADGRPARGDRTGPARRSAWPPPARRWSTSPGRPGRRSSARGCHRRDPGPSAGAGSMTTLARTAAKISRASSLPVMTRTVMPGRGLDTGDHPAGVVARPRSAAVPHATISSAPSDSAMAAKRRDHIDGRPAGQLADHTVGGHLAAEAQHLLVPRHRLQRTVGTHIRHQKVKRVAAQVKCRDAHPATVPYRPFGAADRSTRFERPFLDAERGLLGSTPPERHPVQRSHARFSFLARTLHRDRHSPLVSSWAWRSRAMSCPVTRARDPPPRLADSRSHSSATEAS